MLLSNFHILMRSCISASFKWLLMESGEQWYLLSFRWILIWTPFAFFSLALSLSPLLQFIYSLSWVQSHAINLYTLFESPSSWKHFVKRFNSSKNLNFFSVFGIWFGEETFHEWSMLKFISNWIIYRQLRWEKDLTNHFIVLLYRFFEHLCDSTLSINSFWWLNIL